MKKAAFYILSRSNIKYLWRKILQGNWLKINNVNFRSTSYLLYLWTILLECNQVRSMQTAHMPVIFAEPCAVVPETLFIFAILGEKKKKNRYSIQYYVPERSFMYVTLSCWFIMCDLSFLHGGRAVRKIYCTGLPPPPMWGGGGQCGMKN